MNAQTPPVNSAKRNVQRTLKTIGIVILVMGLLLAIAMYKFGFRFAKRTELHSSKTSTILASNPDTLINPMLQGDVPAIKQALDKDPGLVSAKDSNGETPIFNAVIDGNRDIVALLIDRGADVNAKNNNGETPLDKTTISPNKDIIQLLKSKGAKNGK
jgi:hypothetical protein